MSAFMAQAGSLVVPQRRRRARRLIYEAAIFVRGDVKSLGTDASKNR